MKELRCMKSLLAFFLVICMVFGTIGPLPAYGEEDGTGTENDTPEKTECELNGHDWTDAEWTWSSDNSACLVKLVCQNDGTHTETLAATVEKTVDTPATCEVAGRDKYVATASIEVKFIEEEQEKTEEKTFSNTMYKETNPLGHKYEYTEWEWAEDYSEATAIFTCKNDEKHTTKVTDGKPAKTEVEPTCLEDGSITYSASVEFEGATYEDEKTIKGKAALGHDYQADWVWSMDHTSAVATITCAHDEADTREIEATVTQEDTYTCLEDGQTIYTAKAEFLGQTFTDVQRFKVTAPGHAYGEPEFVWFNSVGETGENKMSAEAEFICTVCGEKETVPCEVSKHDYKETDDAHAKTVYTATCTFEEKPYKVEKTEVDANHENHLKQERFAAEDGVGYDDVTYCTICKAEMAREHVTYTIKYDANGGTGSMADQIADYGVAVSIRGNTFKKTGSHFMGWYVQRESDKMILADVKNGTYEWTSEEALRDNHQYGYVLKDEAILGGDVDIADLDKDVYNVTKLNGDAVTLYAVWESNTYTVNFKSTTGTGSMESMTITYGEGQKLNANTFTRSRYVFKGWYANRESDGKWYAKNASGKKGWYTKSKIKENGYSYVLFKDQSTVSTTTSKNGDVITMVAQWKGIPYKVTYKKNGGTGTMKSTSMIYGTSKATRANAYKKSGYTFKCWHAYRKSDGKWYATNSKGNKGWYSDSSIKRNGYKMVNLKNKVKFSKMAKEKDDTIVLYAQWKKK